MHGSDRDKGLRIRLDKGIALVTVAVSSERGENTELGTLSADASCIPPIGGD